MKAEKQIVGNKSWKRHKVNIKIIGTNMNLKRPTVNINS